MKFNEDHSFLPVTGGFPQNLWTAKWIPPITKKVAALTMLPMDLFRSCYQSLWSAVTTIDDSWARAKRQYEMELEVAAFSAWRSLSFLSDSSASLSKACYLCDWSRIVPLFSSIFNSSPASCLRKDIRVLLFSFVLAFRYSINSDSGNLSWILRSYSRYKAMASSYFANWLYAWSLLFS